MFIGSKNDITSSQMMGEDQGRGKKRGQDSFTIVHSRDQNKWEGGGTGFYIKVAITIKTQTFLKRDSWNAIDNLVKGFLYKSLIPGKNEKNMTKQTKDVRRNGEKVPHWLPSVTLFLKQRDSAS